MLCRNARQRTWPPSCAQSSTRRAFDPRLIQPASANRRKRSMTTWISSTPGSQQTRTKVTHERGRIPLRLRSPGGPRTCRAQTGPRDQQGRPRHRIPSVSHFRHPAKPLPSSTASSTWESLIPTPGPPSGKSGAIDPRRLGQRVAAADSQELEEALETLVIRLFSTNRPGTIDTRAGQQLARRQRNGLERRNPRAFKRHLRCANARPRLQRREQNGHRGTGDHWSANRITHQGPGRNQHPKRRPSTRRSTGTPDTPLGHVRKVAGKDRGYRHECPGPGQREPAGPAGPGTSATSSPAVLDKYPQTRAAD